MRKNFENLVMILGVVSLLDLAPWFWHSCLQISYGDYIIHLGVICVFIGIIQNIGNASIAGIDILEPPAANCKGMYVSADG